MSADRWSICPKCKIDFDKGNERLKLEAGAQYGKVSPEEYLRLLAIADDARKTELEESFREDYYIGIGTDGEGTFEVSYAGSCSRCGLKFEYKHSQQIPLDVPDVALKAEPKRKRGAAK